MTSVITTAVGGRPEPSLACTYAATLDTGLVFLFLGCLAVILIDVVHRNVALWRARRRWRDEMEADLEPPPKGAIN